MNIKPGDLILFLAGANDFLRLVPGVVRAETNSGFEVFAPGSVDGIAGCNQIVARVGPWLSPMGLGAVPTAVEVRILDALSRGLAAIAADNLLQAGKRRDRVGIGDRGKALVALWGQVPKARISPFAAALASVLMVTWRPDVVIECTIADLVDLMGGDQTVTPMMVVTALRELAETGAIQFRDGDGGVRIRWSDTVIDVLDVHPDADLVFRSLGSAFHALLRQAFANALDEIERMGIIDEYRRRDPYAYDVDSLPKKTNAKAEQPAVMIA